MRPSRLLLLLLVCFFAVLVFFSAPRRSARINANTSIHDGRRKTGIRAFFSFRTPLLPSSAIISLTDDNSTFFLSRPAAFGPLLPSHGLSGQLWTGSGFGEDPRGWVGADRMPEGELGCSDVPGWDENLARLDRALLGGALKHKLPSLRQKRAPTANKEDQLPESVVNGFLKDTEKAKKIVKDDGTDDYLHQPLVDTASIRNFDSAADLRLLQESAEIAGKVVLLSRGACGFLEKVKWVQRRGGIGLIVGDNVPGGALVTMYANGDTSDVHIPAIFTSHTTAHLLSSLMPPNGLIGAESTTSKHEGAFNWHNPTKPSLLRGGKHGSQTVAYHKPGFFRRLSSFLGLSQRYTGKTSSLAEEQDANDNFVIGVQDWREPTGGSTVQRTYLPSLQQKQGAGIVRDSTTAGGPNTKQVHSMKSGNSPEKPTGEDSSRASSRHKPNSQHEDVSSMVQHEGLWVTLTPTSMSSSPFFDTILVLVISPLITLTVVYAVLLIRSRIRRRRWRAPKSVVERLPVRTYHTITSSEASTSALATPVASSPATPLLQHMPTTLMPPLPRSRSHSRNRPRSSTTGDVPDPSSHASDDEDDVASMTESEKREKGLAAWRRRYGGKQKECVVCLEEYVDGVSRVMSLPCGHEFHVECITPWLTTRRRTCPICKGDVVRSMARQDPLSSASRNRRDSLDDSDDDGESVQAQAALLRNDSPSAQEPIPVDDEDLERGFTREEGETGVYNWLTEQWNQGRQALVDWRNRRWGSNRRTNNEVDRDR